MTMTTNKSADTVDTSTLSIALIGFGEVGGIFGAALAERGVAALTAYDILLDDPARGGTMRAKAARAHVALAASARAAVADADVVVSAVTASATLAAAESIAAGVRRDAIVLDINSASPGTKVACGGVIASAGGR
jgi:3-hydroxyisobutyrate dehydrogenase-like beta-hydroxyacid dehydrogenase